MIPTTSFAVILRSHCVREQRQSAHWGIPKNHDGGRSDAHGHELSAVDVSNIKDRGYLA
jgi:hypothetical protein